MYPFFLQNMRTHTMYKVCSASQGVKIDKNTLEMDPPEIRLMSDIQAKAEFLKDKSIFLSSGLVPVTEVDYLERLSDFNDQICKRTQNFK